MLRRRFPLGLSGEPPPTWQGLAATLAAVVLATLLVEPLKSVAPVVSLGVIYLPGILLISMVWGLRLGFVASVASAVAFNFFQLPPLHRFTIAEEGNWVALAIFVIVAAASSTVAGLARARAVELERRREEADRALAELEALSRERDRMQAEMVEAEALRRSAGRRPVWWRSISHVLRSPRPPTMAGAGGLDPATLGPKGGSELGRGSSPAASGSRAWSRT